VIHVCRQTRSATDDEVGRIADGVDIVVVVHVAGGSVVVRRRKLGILVNVGRHHGVAEVCRMSDCGFGGVELGILGLDAVLLRYANVLN